MLEKGFSFSGLQPSSRGGHAIGLPLESLYATHSPFFLLTADQLSESRGVGLLAPPEPSGSHPHSAKRKYLNQVAT